MPKTLAVNVTLNTEAERVRRKRVAPTLGADSDRLWSAKPN
ncbi:MAG: hypothetical protein WCD18_18030 [Thermosynechococcaceae cyanobacterium]